MALRIEAVPPPEFEALVPVLSEADEDDDRIRAEITRPGRMAYRALGFRMDHVRRDYFDYFDHPVIERGIAMRDMLVLRRTACPC